MSEKAEQVIKRLGITNPRHQEFIRLHEEMHEDIQKMLRQHALDHWVNTQILGEGDD